MSEKKEEVTLQINGKTWKAKVFPSESVADFLHEHAGLTGTRVCCGMGICKCCAFACRERTGGDAQKMQACITPAKSMQGKELTTVEGLAQKGELTALQEAFLLHFSFQCGYCTSGFLMAASVLLETLKKTPVAPDQIDAAIDQAIGDHICRCTGYVKYHAAVREVVKNTPGLTRA